MNDTDRQIRQRLKDDFEHYASRCLKIRIKSGKIEPLILNKAQLYVDTLVNEQIKKTGMVRVVAVKGRQQGFSTYVEGRYYWRVTHSNGIKAFILTHDAEATNNLFEMAQRYHQYCPEIVRPQTDASNAKELNFGLLDSGYKVGTAGNKGVGRSSTVQLFHGSEVAFWPNAHEHAKGIMQAIPDQPGTEVFLESTANGIGNYFHEQWQMAQSGQSGYLPIFVPWYWENGYKKQINEPLVYSEQENELATIYQLTPEQIAWRRSKIIELSSGGMDGEKAFMQEYPFTSTEAFQTTGKDTFIKPDEVMPARKGKAEQYGALVVGVDPARFGDDRTSIIRRRGRVAFKLESYLKKDTMEVVGLVHKIIKEENPDKIFIDVGGLGAGIVDRLRELGFDKIVEPVNSGETPLDGEKYGNKRAEMWGELKEWLLDKPSQIPDLDSLHADLCGVKYRFDSKTRLFLERKEDMKKRGIKSPDEADALALTFAFPVVKPSDKKPNVRRTGSFMGL